MYKEYHDKNYQKYKYEPTTNYVYTFLKVSELLLPSLDTCLY